MPTHDFSDFPQALYRFALDQITWQNFLVVDAGTGDLKEADNADTLRRDALQRDQYAYWAWWLRFGVGFESLVKAVFLRHEISLLSKRDVAKKAPGMNAALLTPEAAKVYQHVRAWRVDARTNPWLSSELSRLDINHPLEIDSRPLGKYKAQLSRLVDKNVVTIHEKQQLDDAITVLSDIRRNVDAHVLLKTQVGGSINGDLTDVYIPACNLLMRAYK